ncbi:MAG TPA: DUF4193 family protein [Actinomycetota bacterium]|nr:DUF4193 family protein [Actinomycetota bacterium]
MPDDIDQIDEPVDEEDVLLDEDDSLEDAEPTEQDLAEATVPPEPGLGDVESIQDLLAKQETREVEEEAADEEEETVATPTVRGGGDERLEPLDQRVVPMQSTEFMCKNCYLVKHRSQLADKRKMLCRDCA